MERHDHSKLAEIFDLAWNQGAMPRGSFIDQVIRLIMFHQSVPLLEQYPPRESLTDREQQAFFDLDLLKLYGPLCTADSGSYSVHNPKQETLESKRTETLESCERMR